VKRSSRWLAGRFTHGVLLLQGAVVLTFAVTPAWWQPPPGDWLALLWAWMRKPQFYPLVALLVAGPALSIAAALVPGWHRLVLTVAWAGFAAVMCVVWGDRVETMLWVLWWRVGG
jgi:hypothetical protein